MLFFFAKKNQRYNIDFCCGGQRPLALVLEQQKLSSDIIMKNLEEEYTSTMDKKLKIADQQPTITDWNKMSPQQLIEHVTATHHAYLRTELPEISRLFGKVLRAHGKHNLVLFDLYTTFHFLKADLEQHLLMEEMIVFPAIEEKTLELPKGLERLLGEHEAAGKLLEKIKTLSNNYTTPEDGCRSWEMLNKKLSELEKDIHVHVHKENNLLFKMI